jgi:hypothetical protein
MNSTAEINLIYKEPEGNDFYLPKSLSMNVQKLAALVSGLGTVWLHRSMPTFQRNMLSPICRAEVIRLGSKGLYRI